jgi:SAM-dependent methyltransferase
VSKFVVEYGKDTGPATADGRLDAPAFHRNHGPILDVLRRHLGARSGNAIEVGSGTGQHVVEFARAFPGIVWWPTDLRPAHLASIEAWRAHSGLASVMAPVALDVTQAGWRAPLSALPLPRDLAAIVCINVLHIAPWAAAEGLLEGAGRRLAPGGRLFIYGPFARDGAHVSQSNADFDASLRRQDPAWGVRDTRDVAATAAAHGLRLAEIADMPSNNFTLVFEKSGRE